MFPSEYTTLLTSLARPGAFPFALPGESVIPIVQTHASAVLLTPNVVYKLKKPKNYGFFDYSTPALRRHFCIQEVRLNSRLAPHIYLGVAPVLASANDTRRFGPTLPVDNVPEPDSSYEGEEVVDYAVVMVHLPDEATLAARVHNDRVNQYDADASAEMIKRWATTNIYECYASLLVYSKAKIRSRDIFERELGMSKVDAVRFIFKCHNWSEIALLIARHKKPRKVILRDGVSFEAPAIHWWDVDDIFFKHVYDPPFLSFGENDLVVDIGANIGVFTAYAASRTKNNVYAFEPSKSSFAILKRNIAINGLKNVIPHNFAVADRNGVEMFIDAEVSTACKLMSVKSDYTGRPTEVRTTTLQEIIVTNNIEQIDFLKMDCEGSEGLILGSSSIACLKRIKKIAMEFHDGISQVKHDGMQKILEAAGFTTALDWDGRSRLGHLYGWRGESIDLRNEPLESTELAEALTNKVGLSVRN